MSSSTDPFALKAKEQFIEYATMWIEWVAETFPECEETKDVQIFMNSVVKNSDTKKDEQVEAWVSNMTQSLNPKKTKYAKAIERITKEPAVCYHAVMYHDIQALRGSMDSPIVKRVRLFDKYEDASFTDEKRSTTWKFMEKITLAAFEAVGKKLPTVPTRVEIQENIRSRKDKTHDDGPSMTRAFQTHINALCRLLGDKELLDGADDDTIRNHMATWNEFAKQTTNGARNSTLCSQSDPSVLTPLFEKFPELDGLRDERKVDEKVWRNINQLNGFSTVSENIPVKMMGRIEDVANRLADDIVAGRTDMASVNLSDIGQQVLAGCDESDMSKFATNIEELIPALQNFHQR